MESNLSFFSLPFIDNADVDFSKIKGDCYFNDLNSTLPAHGSLLHGTDDVLAQFLSGDELLEEPDLNGPTTLHCEICRKQFDNAKKYYGHLRVHSKDNLWICDKCPDQKFSTKQHLMKHSLTHKPLEKVWRCTHCDITFEALWRLQQHLFAKHLDYRPHKCNRCEMSFQKLSDLKKHKDIHDGIKKHACNKCEMKFNDVSNFKRHMLKHGTEKPYPCPGCGNRFKQIASMKRHSKNCTSISKEQATSVKTIRSNYCRVCGKTFQYKSDLVNHTNREHSNNPPPQQETPKEDKSNEDHMNTNNSTNPKKTHFKKITPAKCIPTQEPSNREILLTTTVNNAVTNINTSQPLNLSLTTVANNQANIHSNLNNTHTVNMTSHPINLHTNIILPPQLNTAVNGPININTNASLQISSSTNIPINTPASLPLNLHANTEHIVNSVHVHANSVNMDHSRTVDNIVDDILSAEDEYLNRNNTMPNQMLHYNPQETDNHENIIHQIELMKEMNQMHILDDELLGHDLDFDSFQTMCNTNDMDYTDKNELLFDINDGRSMDQDIMSALYQVKGGEHLPDLLNEPEILNTTEKVNDYLVNPEVSVNECATIFESDVDLEASTNLAANLNQLIGENSVQYISTEHDDTFIISLNSEIDAEQLTDMLNIGVGTKVDNSKATVNEEQKNVEPQPPVVVKIDIPENVATSTHHPVTKPLTIEISPLTVKESKPTVVAEETSKAVKKKKRTLYVCRKCNKIFNKKDNYVSHRATHDSSLRNHVCEECGERFGYRSTLNKHIRRQHKPPEPPVHICTHCDHKYVAAWMLKRHVARCHELNLQFKCEEKGCGKLFYKQCDLKVHSRFHKNERPYKCEICNRGFYMKSHLNNHIKKTDCTKRVKIADLIKKKPKASPLRSLLIVNNT